ncbi:hypothetical protein P7L78_24960 [Tistrella bauzanensis]|uniref:hypothetical protein n=1 Tax=Tistrella TaxID=171436 RepID=UPI0031F6E030
MATATKRGARIGGHFLQGLMDGLASPSFVFSAALGRPARSRRRLSDQQALTGDWHRIGGDLWSAIHTEKRRR